MQNIIHAYHSSASKIKDRLISCAALAALALLTIATTDQAHAVKMEAKTAIGPLSISVDTILSAGVSVRLKNVLRGRVSSQSGGTDYVRDLPVAYLGASPNFGMRGSLSRISGPAITAANAQLAGGLTQANAGLTQANAGLGLLPAGPSEQRTALETQIATLQATIGTLTGQQAALAPLLPIATALGNNQFGFKNDDDKNFAGNQNNDDGRLNFQDTGDITGATIKALSEIEVNLATEVGDVNFFARVSAYYDPVLYSSFLSRNYVLYDRGNPGASGLRELGKDLAILDVALSWDTAIPTGNERVGDIPISLKVGKLAANNWGEATFTFTGLSQGIVLNVPAARRPGAQIKEIIETEYMVYGSVGLPFGFGLDAYYQFHHTPWTLNPSDAPFAVSDVPNPSSTDATYLWFTGNSTSGTFRRNCDGTGGLIGTVIAPNCAVGSIVDYRTAFKDVLAQTKQRAENIRLENGDLLKGLVRIRDADDQGQFGVQLSYYFPYLNGIEFNASYQNVHSRLPYGRATSDGQPTVTISVISASNAAGQNSLNGLGCTGAGQTGGFLGIDGTGGSSATDNFTDAFIQASAAPNSGVRLNLDPRHFGRNPDEQLANFGTLAAAADTELGRTGVASIAAGIAATGRVTHFDVARINCAIYQNVTGNGALLAVLKGVNEDLAHISPIGTEYLSLQYNIGLELFYPQNLKIIGAGFNMTVPWLEWGLQAEVAWRPDTPLQQDVTEQIITVAAAQGSGTAFGDAAFLALSPLVTSSLDEAYGTDNADTAYQIGRALFTAGALPQVTAGVRLQFIGNITEQLIAAGQDPAAAAAAAAAQVATAAVVAQINAAAQAETARLAALHENQTLTSGFNSEIYSGTINGTFRQSGIIERDMLNITVGTTALYNASHPITRALGATQFVFLTELNVIYFLQDLPKGWDGASGNARSERHSTLQCIRTTGTELPLGPLVGVDAIGDFGCNPDRVSLGYTIYGYLDYNNIFGTAWRFRPSVAIRHAPYGNTPSPLPGWREDTLSVNAGLEFSFQNTWTLALGYVGYFDVGSNDYNINGGFDTASFNVTYAF